MKNITKTLFLKVLQLQFYKPSCFITDCYKNPFKRSARRADSRVLPVCTLRLKQTVCNRTTLSAASNRESEETCADPISCSHSQHHIYPL